MNKITRFSSLSLAALALVVTAFASAPSWADDQQVDDTFVIMEDPNASGGSDGEVTTDPVPGDIYMNPEVKVWSEFPSAIQAGDTVDLVGFVFNNAELPMQFALVDGYNACTLDGSLLTAVEDGKCPFLVTTEATDVYLASETFLVAYIGDSPDTGGVDPRPDPNVQVWAELPTQLGVGDTLDLGKYVFNSADVPMTYSLVDGYTGCSLEGSVLTGVEVGKCAFLVGTAATDLYVASENFFGIYVDETTAWLQSVYFMAPTEIMVGESTDVYAWSTAGLPVTVELASGPCTLDGTYLVGQSAGECVVVASATGDEKYSAADPVQFVVSVIDPSDLPHYIQLDAPYLAVIGQPVEIYAASSKGVDVTVEVVDGDCTLDGTQLTVNSEVKCLLMASAASVDGVADAEPVYHVVVGVLEAETTLDQVIVWDDEWVKRGDVPVDQPVDLGADSNSGLPVDYEVVSGSCSIVDGHVVAKGEGDCVLKAMQDGNALYGPTERMYTLNFAGTSVKMKPHNAVMQAGFNRGCACLKMYVERRVKRLAATLKSAKQVKIKVIGWTPRNATSADRKLARSRAVRLMRQLEQEGVSAKFKIVVARASATNGGKAKTATMKVIWLGL